MIPGYGVSAALYQFIIGTKANFLIILFYYPLRYICTNRNEIWVKIQYHYFKKMHLQMYLCQGTKVGLSCYLVLLSIIDSKTR